MSGRAAPAAIALAVSLLSTTALAQTAPADAVQQLETELGLEVLDGARYRGLGAPEHVSRLGDAAAGSNRKESLEITGFHTHLKCEFCIS